MDIDFTNPMIIVLPMGFRHPVLKWTGVVALSKKTSGKSLKNILGLSESKTLLLHKVRLRANPIKKVKGTGADFTS